jgi:hypothetical protein
MNMQSEQVGKNKFLARSLSNVVYQCFVSVERYRPGIQAKKQVGKIF